jgi:hypothetical protein
MIYNKITKKGERLSKNEICGMVMEIKRDFYLQKLIDREALP